MSENVPRETKKDNPVAATEHGNGGPTDVENKGLGSIFRTAAQGQKRSAEKNCLSADGGAEGAGEGLAEALHVGVMLGFDHDASEWFGAGVSKNYAAIVTEGGLSLG